MNVLDVLLWLAVKPQIAESNYCSAFKNMTRALKVIVDWTNLIVEQRQRSVPDVRGASDIS